MEPRDECVERPCDRPRSARMDGWRRCGAFRSRDRRVRWSSWSAMSRSPARARCGSGSRPVASATATSITRKGPSPAFSIRACPVTKSRASSMPSERECAGGRGTARRHRLAWRTLRLLRLLPPRRFPHLPHGPRSPASLRRRLCGLSRVVPAEALALIPDGLTPRKPAR